MSVTLETNPTTIKFSRFKPRFIKRQGVSEMDIRELINRIKETLATHSLGRTGEYARWIWQDGKGTRDVTVIIIEAKKSFTFCFILSLP